MVPVVGASPHLSGVSPQSAAFATKVTGRVAMWVATCEPVHSLPDGTIAAYTTRFWLEGRLVGIGWRLGGGRGYGWLGWKGVWWCWRVW